MCIVRYVYEKNGELIMVRFTPGAELSSEATVLLSVGIFDPSTAVRAHKSLFSVECILIFW